MQGNDKYVNNIFLVYETILCSFFIFDNENGDDLHITQLPRL
jgi:hypothetical protein